jgi:hypothetical protein
MSVAAILKLQASGFSSDQVSALAELLDTQVATKADVEAAEHRLELKINGLELKIGGVKTDLELKIGGVKTDLELKISDVRSEINVLKWMIGFILAFQLGIFAKLFLH